MKKKRLLAILLCLSMTFVFLTACGSDAATEEEEESVVEISEESKAASEEFPADETNASYTALAQEVKAVWDEKYQYGVMSVAGVGETLQNAFFKWTVNSVKTKTEINGTSAGDGYKFVVANITMVNTTDYEFESGNYEFRGIIGPEEEDDLDSVDAFYDEMLPDEFNLKAGEEATGDLLFKVKEDVDEIIIDFESFYGNGKVDGANWVVLPL